MIMWLIMVPGIIAGSSLLWLLATSGELRSVLMAGIALCIVLFFALMYKPTRWYAAALTLGLPLFLIILLQPVCVPVDDITLDGMNPPIHMRADRDIYMDVFQQEASGSWKQCRTKLSRLLFF